MSEKTRTTKPRKARTRKGTRIVKFKKTPMNKGAKTIEPRAKEQKQHTQKRC